MENIIMCNLNNIAIVSMNDSQRRMCKTHIFQLLVKSEKFKDSISKSTVFCLDAGARHNILFVTALGNKRVAQKERKTSSKAAVSRIPCPVNIRISTKVKGGMSREVKAIEHLALDIAEDVKHNIIMCRVRSS